jgi:hypothetical protein
VCVCVCVCGVCEWCMCVVCEWCVCEWCVSVCGVCVCVVCVCVWCVCEWYVCGVCVECVVGVCVFVVCVFVWVQVHSLSEYRKAFNKNATEPRSAILYSSSCFCCSIYKAVMKPIWSYGIELWDCASKSNIAIMQRSQSKTLRAIANTPRYATKHTLHTDCNIPYVSDVIH